MLNASGSKLQDKANIRRIFASKSTVETIFHLVHVQYATATYNYKFWGIS